ncbi:PilL protein [Burkholderia pseudomallei MSHR1043]|nr:PilL protein [Burkholderia pseudomallei MSHR1043]
MQDHVEAFALLFLGHAQADHDVDHLQQHEADDAAVDERDRDALGLQQQAAVRAADVLDREHAREQRAENAAHAVHAERVERIVVAELVLEPRRRPEADDARRDADHERARDADEAGGRRDRDETRDRARHDAEHRRLTLGDPFGEHPAERGARGGDLRRQHREAGAAVRGHRGARVEAEPAHPQHRATDQRQHQVVRRHRFAAVADALAEHEARHEARDAGVDVHDRAAREVEHAVRRQPARRLPDHVRDRHVDDQRPQRHEDEHRREFHPVGERAADERRRDDRERHLVDEVDRFRDRRREMADGERRRLVAVDVVHPGQEHAREAADEAVARREREAVADHRPEDRDQRGDREALHHGREHVLLADHAAVEEREARDRHEQHERGRREHPRGVARVDLRRIDRERRGRRGGRGGGRSRRGGGRGRGRRRGGCGRCGGRGRCGRGGAGRRVGSRCGRCGGGSRRRVVGHRGADAARKQRAGHQQGHQDFAHLGFPLIARVSCYRASAPVSPVRIRITCSIDVTKILPSPILPVRAARSIASTAWSTRSSDTAASIFILGRKSTTYSAPRYSSVCPFWRPNPLTSVTVMPETPSAESASRVSSSLNGLMIAVISFMKSSRYGGNPITAAMCGGTPTATRMPCRLTPVSKGFHADFRHRHTLARTQARLGRTANAGPVCWRAERKVARVHARPAHRERGSTRSNARKTGPRAHQFRSCAIRGHDCNGNCTNFVHLEGEHHEATQRRFQRPAGAHRRSAEKLAGQGCRAQREGDAHARLLEARSRHPRGVRHAGAGARTHPRAARGTRKARRRTRTEAGRRPIVTAAAARIR